jgi:hypothetical protein
LTILESKIIKAIYDRLGKSFTAIDFYNQFLVKRGAHWACYFYGRFRTLATIKSHLTRLKNKGYLILVSDGVYKQAM